MTVDVDNLRIIHHPDPRLRRRAREVRGVDADVRAVAERMIELMREADGIGLAAPQVGLDWRLFVARVPAPEDPDILLSELPDLPDDVMLGTAGPTVYINPVISDPAGGLEQHEEGCLSLPDIRGDVVRPIVVTIEATDLEGRRFTQRGAGLLARCWQHEVDHLDGVLIIDKFTQISRLKTRLALRALERAGG